MVDDVYMWIRAWHIIAVIAWLAGLLYLPRLFVYHSVAKKNSTESNTFQVMERRLLIFIMHPAMLMSLILGAILLGESNIVDWEKDIWIYCKLFFVGILVVIHIFLARCRREFELGQNKLSPKFFKIINEIPTISLIAIIIFVVLKPF